MSRKFAVAATSLPVALLVSAAFVAGGATPSDAGGGTPAKTAAEPIGFAATDLFIEINATDGDAGLQLNLDGEKWDRLQIVNPRGQTILDVSGSSRLRGYGLTGLTFESAEPPFTQFPFSKFKARFPAGKYRFRGTTVSGRRLVGSDTLTHVIPQAPVIVSPTENAAVPAQGVVVQWRRVTKPTGIRIVHYQVIVTQERPKRVLDVTMPPTATQLSIPPEFLRPGRDYAVEVLAREASGNQTISEVAFRTG